MECSCTISAGVDYFSQILSEKWITARKSNMCHECGRQIINGERYYLEKSLHDGCIDTHKTCAVCKSIQDNLVNDFYWWQVLELVSEAISGCYDKIPEKCIAKLTPNARDWVCCQIENQWDDEEATYNQRIHWTGKNLGQ